MKVPNTGIRLSAIFLAGCLLSPLLSPARALASEYGRLAGIVSDNHGIPLMGATVLVLGPLLSPAASAGEQAERVITDAQGKFAVGHLIPGWYSLQIVSPTRLPAHRNGIKVEAGQTSTLKFVLGDVFAPLRFQLPDKPATTLGDDWKWVLRTSAATRPILRFRQQVAETDPSSAKPPLPASQGLVGMVTGSSSRDPLASDPGTESVLAYVRSLSLDSDLLSVGSVAATGNLASSVGTEYRKGLINSDFEEISLVVHRMGYAGGVIAPGGGGQLSDSYAQGLVASYTQTRYIYPHLTLTTGMEIDYLNALRDVVITRPRMKLSYRLSRSTEVALQVGSGPPDGSGALLDRISRLDSFPLLTLRDNRPELEQLDHSEISLNHRLNGSARFELAAYHDGVKNAAVWGSSNPGTASWLSGNYMLNPAGDGVFVNMGDYHSSGYRVAYTQRLGNRVETLVAYVVGDSLYAHDVVSHAPEADLQGVLKPVRSGSLAGRVSARIPVTRTQLTSSYEWVQRGRVTTADPYGQADMQLQPFLDVQIRQPLPTLAFLPGHIEAVADFRNLLSQGYSPLTQSGARTLLLSSAYKSIRGGFSVQF
ncbi:MAG: carboxypeptidase regulatory-like domain-containing protein [Terriglobia bacterium]